MLVTHTERPRDLKWYHAGPMLYGDWGTSRFYVLGLALFYALHASFWYVFAVGLLVAAVGWAYTIICRCYPDGGGVYSAAKHSSRQLAVVGALLLFADYIVTAAMSAYDGIRYWGIPKEFVPYMAMGAIFAVGLINYIGPKKAGTVALVITLMTLILTAILTAFSIAHLHAGWMEIVHPTQPLAIMWTSFVAVVLALSGVEAIANMTGIMVPPVTKTANKAIWPVLIEVVLLNIVLAIAMNGLPAAGYDLGKAPVDVYEKVEHIKDTHPGWAGAPAGVETQPQAQARSAAIVSAADGEFAALSHEQNIPVAALKSLDRSEDLKHRQEDSTDAVLRVMAKVYVDPYVTIHWGDHSVGLFSLVCGFVFGLLLLSAVNTAVADMISIQYVMSRDTELPHVLTKLNKFGVPWLTLIAAVGLPVVILCIFQDLSTLASLYAVGVVGAIAINLGSCSLNREMPVKKWERTGLAVLAMILVGIEATLVWEKPDARYFALFVLCSGLAARFFTKTYPRLNFRNRGLALAVWAAFLISAAAVVLHLETDISKVVQAKVVLFKNGDSAQYFTYILSSLLLMFGGASATYGIRYLAGKMHVPAAPIPIGGGLAVAGGPGIAAGPGAPAAEESVPDMTRPHVLVATRGGPRLLEFAANYCHKTNTDMIVLFVRQINIVMGGPAAPPHLHDDADAVKAFAMATDICRKAGVKMIPMYVVSSDVAYSILDFAATYAVEAVLMGVSRVGSLLRALRGDVITAVADNLPEDISLLIHA